MKFTNTTRIETIKNRLNIDGENCIYGKTVSVQGQLKEKLPLEEGIFLGKLEDFTGTIRLISFPKKNDGFEETSEGKEYFATGVVTTNSLSEPEIHLIDIQEIASARETGVQESLA